MGPSVLSSKDDVQFPSTCRSTVWLATKKDEIRQWWYDHDHHDFSDSDGKQL